MEFKVGFQHVSIRVQKDLGQKGQDLPYLETDDVIDVVLDRWLAKWHNASDSVMGSSKSTVQHKKEEAKLKMAQLAENRKKEADDKA